MVSAWLLMTTRLANRWTFPLGHHRRTTSTRNGRRLRTTRTTGRQLRRPASSLRRRPTGSHVGGHAPLSFLSVLEARRQGAGYQQPPPRIDSSHLSPSSHFSTAFTPAIAPHNFCKSRSSDFDSVHTTDIDRRPDGLQAQSTATSTARSLALLHICTATPPRSRASKSIISISVYLLYRLARHVYKWRGRWERRRIYFASS